MFILRRRPSAATLAAVVLTLTIGSQTSLAARSNDNSAPRPVRSISVTAADSSSVTVAWPPTRDNFDVVGYGLYVNGSVRATTTPEKALRINDLLGYRLDGLGCGTGYTVGVDAYDSAQNRSPQRSTMVSTAACVDTSPPSAPGGVRQVAATESSVVLTWTPSADDIGVVEYGLYASGVKVATVTDASATITNLSCGKTYLIGLDAADAAGNHSTRVDSYFTTSGCPSTNKPPSTPTGLKVTKTTGTSVALAWTASTDDAGVTSYGLYLAGTRTAQTAATNWALTGLQCGTTYAFGIDAADASGKRSGLATLSGATSPCASPSTGSLTQSIAGGSSLSGAVNWRAVYDANGDKIEDDPGSMRFLVDGKVVLTEVTPPFGDTTNFWSSNSVGDGTHTFEVRAVNDAGTLVAQNTVTATVANTPPAQPPASSGKLTQTIAGGSTLSGRSNWRAVYDANGDKIEDDPGSMRFLVDGKVVLTEVTPPFGDTTNFWSSNSVGDGTHTFEVRAVNDAGTLVAQNTVTATVANTASESSSLDTAAPSQPGGLRVTSATATSVAISWSPASDNVGVAGYGLYRGTSRVGTTSQTTTSFGGLTCGTAYQVGIDAYDAAGNASSRATMSVTTSPCIDAQAPSTPSNVTVSSRTATSIALTWAPSNDNVGVVGYQLYRGGVQVSDTAGTTGIFSGLSCGTNYTLGVDAYDAAGNDSTQAVLMVATTPCADSQPPSVPTQLTASSPTSTSITLGWAPSTDNAGVSGYDVFRSGTKLGSTSSPGYTFSGLSCGTAYTLGVAAFDVAGNRSQQAQLAVTTSTCASQPTTGSVYVSPSGSDANGCTQAAPCRSLDRGYHAAKPGQTVVAAAGNYGAQTVTSDATKTGANVVISAAGATVGDLRFEGATNLEVRGVAANLVYVGQNSSSAAGQTKNIVLRSIDTRYFFARSVDGLQVYDSRVGGTQDGSSATIGGAYQSTVPSKNVVLDNVTFHDIGRANNPSSHVECLFAAEIDGMTIRNSRFLNCDVFDVYFSTIACDTCQGTNVVITGTQFGTNGNYGLFFRADDPNKLRNFRIENNWFQEGTGFSSPYTASKFENFTVSGNYGQWSSSQQLQGITFSSNRFGQNPPSGWPG